MPAGFLLPPWRADPVTKMPHPRVYEPTRLFAGETKVTSKATACSLQLSSPCQLTQDVARCLGDDKLASRGGRGPGRLCDGRVMGRSR